MTGKTPQLNRYTSTGMFLLRGAEVIGKMSNPDIAAAVADVLNWQPLLDRHNKRAMEIVEVLWP